ncbi:MBL fold metallo-hydrolase [Elioraea rosea]|uniref:MBL fold metallo-hydrolase n=1 Tax=Elioraea rosea TaxID=2492390 RepID=UPI0011829B73|nr:MBL fold metallo-hydrolase [Elioraea rosea]
MKVIVLGCGSSGGVPLIGGRWGRCDPSDPRNRRTRASILVETEGRTLLVDTTPDLRAQLLAAERWKLDAVLYTHAHADHIMGLDDLRAVNRLIGAPLPAFADGRTLADLRRRFDYAFQPLRQGSGFFRPVLEPVEIVPGEPFEAAGVSVLPVLQDHGFMPSLGFRIGDFAYSTDVLDLDEAALAALEGVRVWIVGCFQERPHVTHAHLERALSWVARLKPERTVLTHMGEGFDYATLSAILPAGVEPGYDGLVLDV